MAALTRLILLSLYLLSLVSADEEEDRIETVKWLDAGRSVLIYLATPDLFYWSKFSESATQYPGAFIFNLTTTPDSLTLLLNDEPILPRASAYLPAPLRAYQTGETVSHFAQRINTNFTDHTAMNLDYWISYSSDPTSGTSIYNTKYNQRIRVDIQRAHIPTSQKLTTPLSSQTQDQIWIFLEDMYTHPPNTDYANIPFRIRDVKIDRRYSWEGAPSSVTYRAISSLKTCRIWSWRCADIDEYPYYTFIYQENFDEYGKKGSMRHFLATRWGNLVGLMGFWKAVAWVAVCGSMVLSPVVYAGGMGVERVVDWIKGVIEVHRRRMREVDEWNEDEEVGGLLEGDRYVGVVEMVDRVSGKGEEKTTIKSSLPFSPPSVKTEKSYTS